MLHGEVYIDNVRIFGESEEEVRKAVANLLIRCAKAGITVNVMNVKPLVGLTPAK